MKKVFNARTRFLSPSDTRRYSTARPQEAGLNWDKATTTEDFFVHRQNRGPASAMPPELLPTDAAAVTGKMKWTSCALVGNSAVLLSGGVRGLWV